jgi:hypothetical protein
LQWGATTLSVLTRLAKWESTGSILFLFLLGRGRRGRRNSSQGGRQSERGRACTPHPRPAGQKIPPSLSVRKKVAIASLYVLSRMWHGRIKIGALHRGIDWPGFAELGQIS